MRFLLCWLLTFVQDASQAHGWQLLKLADFFVQYGQDSVVERMMYEKAQQEMYSSAAEWLKNHHLAKNNLPAALEMAELIFHKRPWFLEYQKMREISMELGNWESVRQEALTFLETTKNISTLVEAALDEGDIERALQLLKATKPSGPDGYQWQYDYARTPEVALKAAERTELRGKVCSHAVCREPAFSSLLYALYRSMDSNLHGPDSGGVHRDGSR